MKRPIVVTIGLFAALTFSPLFAQTARMHANIPFDFQVEEVHMPAGEYTICISNVMLQMQEDGGDHRSVFSITSRTPRLATKQKAHLLFNRYGNAYFLSQIWNSGPDDGRALQPSRREKEVASRAGSVEQATVAIKTNGSVASR